MRVFLRKMSSLAPRMPARCQARDVVIRPGVFADVRGQLDLQLRCR